MGVQNIQSPQQVCESQPLSQPPLLIFFNLSTQYTREPYFLQYRYENYDYFNSNNVLISHENNINISRREQNTRLQMIQQTQNEIRQSLNKIQQTQNEMDYKLSEVSSQVNILLHFYNKLLLDRIKFAIREILSHDLSEEQKKNLKSFVIVSDMVNYLEGINCHISKLNTLKEIGLEDIDIALQTVVSRGKAGSPYLESEIQDLKFAVNKHCNSEDSKIIKETFLKLINFLSNIYDEEENV